MKSISEKPFADWIGRKTEADDQIIPRLDASFRAIFGDILASTADGDAALGLHWCLSPAIAAMENLGPDGHPAKSLDLPPVPQPRRMWAGGQVKTLDALRVGDHVRRISTITDVTCKTGRSGELWFVTVDHEYMTDRGLAVKDRQNIVYREAPKTGGPAAAVPSVDPQLAEHASISVETSATLLFRYSALTFNGHRIHYDYPYATQVEGYDGLVVHGPIQATLMLNLAAKMLGRTPARFDYRGVSPAIAGTPIFACGNRTSGRLWTRSQAGQLHMEANASI